MSEQDDELFRQMIEEVMPTSPAWYAHKDYVDFGYGIHPESGATLVNVRFNHAEEDGGPRVYAFDQEALEHLLNGVIAVGTMLFDIVSMKAEGEDEDDFGL